jgi:hypothetical protein
MVFDKDRSIVAGMKQGDSFVFKNIPANRSIRVIAIDNPAGKPRMEEIKQNTSVRKCTIQKMQPITLADLDDALCWN